MMRALPAPAIQPSGAPSMAPAPAGRQRGGAGAASLWLALLLPDFPLEVLLRAEPDAAAPPTVIVSGTGSRRLVIACNRAATAAGVTRCMSEGAAHALVPALRVIARDPAAEQHALAALAAWAGQFTSSVSLQPPAGLLLEIGGSLKLFGGLERLLEQVGGGLRALDYRWRSAVAPTPQAAWLLARAGCPAPLLQRHALAAALAPVPVECLDLPADLVAALHGMGVHSFGDCARLPRDGLTRRLGTRLVDVLDRALGRRPDPRESFRPSPVFERVLPLPVEITDVERLAQGGERLLRELCGLLQALDAGVQRLELRLFHRGLPPGRVLLGLVAPSRSLPHLLSLLRERLALLALPAPVTQLQMVAGELVALAPGRPSLFGDGQGTDGNWSQLVERLRARLGVRAVSGLGVLASHRPERAWTRCQPGEITTARITAERPLWLLAAPQRLHCAGGAPVLGGRLRLLDGPERVESGWWDGADVARDYYVTENEQGERLWVYRDLRGQGAWYLHGLFG